MRILGNFVQEAEAKAKNMEDEISRLQKILEEKNGQIEESTSVAEKVPISPSLDVN